MPLLALFGLHMLPLPAGGDGGVLGLLLAVIVVGFPAACTRLVGGGGGRAGWGDFRIRF